MIVPRPRLIFWTAAFAIPATACAIEPALALPTLGAGALFVAGVALDAWMGRRRIRGLSVVLPDSLRMTANRPSEIPVEVRSETGLISTVVLGLPLPADFSSPNELLEVALPAGIHQARVGWTCTPERRGRYGLDRCWFQCASPAGFWDVGGSSACRLELRVYPNLMGERRRLSALFLRRQQAGIHTQRMVGHGREFEKLREYVPGDMYEDIHWKATARRGKPITKLFQIERTQEIYVLADTSRISARLIGDDPVLERYVVASLVLGQAAEQQGDLFGLLTFDDHVRRFIRAGRGRGHYNVCRDAVYTLESRPVTPDFDELASFLRLNLRKRALLLALVDLADPMLAESFLHSIELVCRHHLVMVFMIRPPGVRELFSTPVGTSEDAIYAALGGHYFLHDLRELGTRLRHKGVEFIMTEQESLCGDMISRYMNVKARQAL